MTGTRTARGNPKPVPRQIVDYSTCSDTYLRDILRERGVGSVSVDSDPPDLSEESRDSLRAMAKEAGLTGYSKLSADDLRDAVAAASNDASEVPIDEVDRDTLEALMVGSEPSHRITEVR